LVDFFTELLKK